MPNKLIFILNISFHCNYRLVSVILRRIFVSDTAVNRESQPDPPASAGRAQMRLSIDS